MSASQDERDDGELLDLIGQAFSAQQIPRRPSDEQTLAEIQENLSPPILTSAAKGVSRSRFFAVLASIPAIAAGIVLAVAIWRTESQPVKTQVKKDAPTKVEDATPEPNNPKVVAQKPTTDPAQIETPLPELLGTEQAKQDRVDGGPTAVVYWLKYLDAKTAATRIKEFLGDKSNARVDADSRLNSISLTCTAAQHNSVLGLLQKIDQKIVIDRAVVYTLKHLHAEDAADLLRRSLRGADERWGVDEQKNLIVINGTPEECRSIRQFLTKIDTKEPCTPEILAQAVKELDPKERQSHGAVLSGIQLLNRCWVQGVGPNKTQAKEIEALFNSSSEEPDDLSDDLSGAFVELGLPKSIRAVENQVDRAFSWVHGPYDYPFTYTVDFPLLMTDAERFVNYLTGEEIFAPMLDGILEDEEGPLIDIRHVVTTFRDRVMVVVRSGATEDRVMIVIPLSDTKEASAAIEKVGKEFERHVEKTIYKGVDLYENNRHLDEDLAGLGFDPVVEGDDDAVTGYCVVGRCLVIGDSAMVREAIERRSSIAR